MRQSRQARRALSVAIVVLVFGQLALAYTIARDRFSFVNLVDVATPESFDDPARVIGDARQFDLTFPTDEDFAFEVERGKATLPASDADRFQWAVRWVHSQLEFRRTPSRETIFTPRSAWSATDVLSGSRSGKRYWCDSYARLTASVAHALGLTARVIWLDGHVTVEAYDRERRGWIGADPTLPALLVHPSSAEELSFAQAAALVRSSTPIDVRLLGSETMSASQERSLLYLHRALERDLLAYVDGETAVLGNTPRSLLDWLVGASSWGQDDLAELEPARLETPAAGSELSGADRSLRLVGRWPIGGALAEGVAGTQAPRRGSNQTQDTHVMRKILLLLLPILLQAHPASCVSRSWKRMPARPSNERA